MRYGFTTGSCAAAAAKAAAYMLLTGREKQSIRIRTPKGIDYEPRLLDTHREERFVSCAVEKDGGDDPDITTGTKIYATVAYGAGICGEKDAKVECPTVTAGTNRSIAPAELPDGEASIRIEGGTGVGRVTKPGLDQPVGSAAINHVPREMIEREVREVCRLCDFCGELLVTVSVPEGEALAERTFNPRLGIEGGISILGTSGIVEPMSTDALLETIRIELRQRVACGERYLAMSPGNYGMEYMKRAYGFDPAQSVKCSNFIGAAVEMAREEGVKALLLTGHIGKLIKVSGGIRNTHSREADGRMELLAAAALQEGVDRATVLSVLDSSTTEEALGLLNKVGKVNAVTTRIIEKIKCYLNKWSGPDMQIECILFSNEFGELAKTDGAEELCREIAKARG